MRLALYLPQLALALTASALVARDQSANLWSRALWKRHFWCNGVDSETLCAPGIPTWPMDDYARGVVKADGRPVDPQASISRNLADIPAVGSATPRPDPTPVVGGANTPTITPPPMARNGGGGAHRDSHTRTKKHKTMQCDD